MQEKLISYLLGDLSPDEAAEVEQRVADDPALADQLERLRGCLGVQAENETAEPAEQPTPTGLADRTADSVEMLVCGLGRTAESKTDTSAGRCSFSLLDAAVAVGVVAAVGMMLVPALRESRETTRRITCQNQLREIGYALRAYAADHGGYLPMPPEGANAGSFTIILADSGYLDRRRLAACVVCPGSDDASRVATAKLRVHIPTFDELESATGKLLISLRKGMALNVAYRSPQRVGDRLRPIRDEGNHRSPLLSDAPSIVDGRWRNLNHGGGLNVLFQDGSVRYQLDFREPIRQDHFFVNTNGQPAPPTRSDDAVLMRSGDVLRVTPVANR